MTNIYFIRHGQTPFGTKNNNKLSDIGMQQVELLADYIIDMEAYFPAVYSSSKESHIETAEMIISRLKENEVETNYNILPDLDEFNVFNLLKFYKDDIAKSDPPFAEELKRFAKNRKAFQGAFIKLLKWSATENCDGIKSENFNAFKNRIQSAIKTIMDECKDYKKVAVVTSGDVLAVVMQMVQGLKDLEAMDLVWEFYNASMTVCYAERNRLELRLNNSVIHITNQGNNDLLTHI